MSNPHTPSPVPDLNRNRLPTLFEVLSRRTLPPVDLFSFYIFMRDQQRSVDYLDFWYGKTKPKHKKQGGGCPANLSQLLTNLVR